MDTSLLTSTWLLIGAYASATIFSFTAALIISSGIRKNKGAKTNRAWALMSLGLILSGLSYGSRMTEHFGFPLLQNWDGILVLCGSGFFLLGAALWQGLVKKAIS